MATPETLANYIGETGHLHMVISPHSTQHEEVVDSSTGALVRVFGSRVNIIEIEAKAELTQEKIANVLKAGDAIVSAGGDGCDSLSVNTLLAYPGISEEVRSTPVLSLPGGNANQGPRQFTPYRLKPPHILEIIEKGLIAEFYPAKVKITETVDVPTKPTLDDIPDEIDTERPNEKFQDIDTLALYFADLGIIGNTMEVLDQIRHKLQNTHRVIRGLRELPAAIRGIQQSRLKPMAITQELSDPGGHIIKTEYPQAYLAVVVVGDRVAKYFRCPNELEEEAFYELVMTDIRWASIFATAAKMRRAKVGEVVDNYGLVKISFETKNEEETYLGQIDGQTFELPKKGVMTVQQHKASYRAVTLES